MTGTVAPEDRLLLALIAVFSPSQAERLLSQLGPPGAEPMRAEGVRMAAAPRRARLLALSESLEPTDDPFALAAELVSVAPRPRGRSAVLSRHHSQRNPATWRRHAP
jgi:hypothetical protein